MKISDFSFDLPEELIAQEPAATREAARLLVIRRNPQPGEPRFEDLLVSDLSELIEKTEKLKSALWIRNRSKVLPMRFYVRRSSGGRHEILLTHELEPGIWNALIRNSGKIKFPCEVETEKDSYILSIEGPTTVNFSAAMAKHKISVEEILELVGEMPLPPYIKNRNPLRDRVRYQPVWADAANAKSAAAPTASLHFSEDLEKKLLSQGIEFSDVYLHVGLGTFEPLRHVEVLANTLHDEIMEVASVNQKKIADAITKKRPLVTVGTTALRVLESLKIEELGSERTLKRPTNIFMHPMNPPQRASALWTNFHLPESSLFILIAAFAGSVSLAKEAYQHAISKKYRFFSYGDASLWL